MWGKKLIAQKTENAAMVNVEQKAKGKTKDGKCGDGKCGDKSSKKAKKATAAK
jgi:uncharacterized low-complexity protein